MHTHTHTHAPQGIDRRLRCSRQHNDISGRSSVSCAPAAAAAAAAGRPGPTEHSFVRVFVLPPLRTCISSTSTTTRTIYTRMSTSQQQPKLAAAQPTTGYYISQEREGKGERRTRKIFRTDLMQV